MFLKQQPNKSVARHSESGFSLIEVAIALLVISIVMGGMLQLYNVYAIKKQENDTKNRIATVQSALTKYVENYGHYPRPAHRNIRIGLAGFGKEAAVPTTLCTVDPSVACLATGGTVYIGDVPFAALGITYRTIADSYGSKLMYAVTAPLTQPGTYSDANGVIDVKVNDGTQQFTGTTPKAHFFISSPGPDKAGAYSLAGVQISPCGTAATNGEDFENCNGDATFRSNYETNPLKYEFKKYVRRFAAGATNFDDLTGYQNSTSSGLWSLTPNLGNLVNTNTGNNILVGTMTVLPGASCSVTNVPGCIVPPQTRLEVKGTIAGTELRTKRICYNAGANCPSPATEIEADMLNPTIIAGIPNTTGTYNSSTLGNAGGGILCPSKNGLRGFNRTSTGYLDEVCTDSIAISNPISLSPTDCIAGRYASGISATGVIICSP